MHQHSPGSPVLYHRSARRRQTARIGSVLAAAIAVAAASGPAAHAAVRADGRHYELVSPVDKLSHGARAPLVSADGATVAFDTEPGNGSPGDESHGPAANAYLSQRTASAWLRSSWNLPATDFLDSKPVDLAPDLSTRLYLANTADEAGRGASAFYSRRAPGAAPERVGPVLQNQPGGDPRKWEVNYVGSSADGHRIVVSPNGVNVLMPGEPRGNPSRPAFYEVRGATDTAPESLRRIDVDDAQTPISPTCGAELGSDGHTAGAITEDGRKVFFSAWPGSTSDPASCDVFSGGVPRQIFARVDGTTTTEVSASECTRPDSDPCQPVFSDMQFEAASADGRRVAFSSVDQLVNGDDDFASDLYLYDFDAPVGQRLTRVSAPPAPGPTFQGFLRIADDGSRLYYVAQGAMADNENAVGAVASPDGPNLYVYDVADERTEFVATLDWADAGAWSGSDIGAFRPFVAADPAGRVLVFQSAARVTPDDEDASPDVFRFDAAGGALERLSRGAGTGGNAEVASGFTAPSFAQTDIATQRRTVSADGNHALFSTDEALSPDDLNGVSDVYEWSDGQVSMVSDGQDPLGAGTGGLDYALSADGSTVTFTTSRALVPSDRDTAVDVYALRSGVDVDPPPPGPPAPCAGTACEGLRSPAPVAPTPASPFYAGPGNVTPPPPVPSATPRVRARSSVRGTQATVRVTVRGAGRITVTGTGLRRVTRQVSRAGTYRVTTRLRGTKLRSWRSGKTVEVRATVWFQPKTGVARKSQVSVRFEATAQKKDRS